MLLNVLFFVGSLTDSSYRWHSRIKSTGADNIVITGLCKSFCSLLCACTLCLAHSILPRLHFYKFSIAFTYLSALLRMFSSLLYYYTQSWFYNLRIISNISYKQNCAQIFAADTKHIILVVAMHHRLLFNV